ncbi:MAG: SpoIIE family protein phosphatase [Candidatus Stygibacter frigidus]|nr:SpoIIE family protein phosphatase [Candidatus Stygibacter frigidus]
MEDSKTQAMKLEYLLYKNGYEPVLAASGEQAIELVNQQEPDLIISDILMPAMSGYEFCRQMKNFVKTRHTPLIFLSALSDTHDILKGLACGASNFMTKPCKDEILIKSIEQQFEVTTESEAVQDDEVVKLVFEEKEYYISAPKSRILEILVTTYETAINKNQDLAIAQGELKNLNLQLEDRVKEKTAHLQAEIRERKKAQSELYKLSNVVHQAKNIIVITDLEGNIEYANPRFTEITGYTLTEAIGKNPRLLKSDEHDDAFYRNLWETVMAGKEWKGEFTNKAKNGDLIYENASIFDIRDSNGTVRNLAKISEDITERKQNEVQIERLYASLLEDIELASSVQSYLLPDWLVHENNISITSVYSPSEKVGGDIFDIIQVSASQYAVYIGDISGHGVQAALIMTAVKSTINMLVNMEKSNVRPHYIVNKLNEILSKDFFQTNYLTMIFCLVDLEKNTIKYLNAGHPALIEYNKHTTDTRIIDMGSSIPVGWMASYQYEEEEEVVMEMSPDSIYFLYTDGLFECLNYEGMELGMSGFTSFLEKFRDNMNSIILPFMIKQLLIEENYDLKGDDFTLLTLQKFDASSMQDRILLRYTSKNRKAVSLKAEAFIKEKFDDHQFYLTINSVIANYFHNVVEKESDRKVDNSILLQMKIDVDLELTFWEKFDSNKIGYQVNGKEGLHQKDYIMDSNFIKYPLRQNRYDEIVETIVNIQIIK